VLSLEGTPVINGGFGDAQSALTLEFLNSGSYAGALPGVVAIKDGRGTFTLSMLNPTERIEVRQGTLHLTRDYRFLPQGLFAATVYGDGSHGQFRIGGVAQLGGRMSVSRGPGAYVDGTMYDVLLADGGIAAGSAFESIELPDPTRLLAFSAQQLPDSLRIEIDVKSFTTVATTANELSIAGNLDRILPRVKGDLNAALGTIQTLTRDADFATAFASLSPAAYEHYSRASLSSLQQYGQTLQDRMTALHVAAVPGAPGEPVRVAFDGSLGRLLAAPEERADRAHGVWMKAFAQRGKQDAHATVNGYDHSLAGLALGIDQRFGSSFLAGLSIGQASNTVKADLDRSDADITSRLFALYGSYFDRALYVDGTLSAGRNDYDTRRTIVVGPTATPVTSRHRGNVLAASLGAGTLVRAGSSWLDPFASLQYTRLTEDGFSENGSGAGLVVAGRTTRALVSNVGLRWLQVFGAAGDATWTPEASLAWLHDFDRSGHLINAAYLDAPDASFSIAGQPVGKNGAVLGLGVTYRTSRGLATFLRYKGEFRSHYAAHGVVGELRYEF
jgi:outer membrane autotransporter protein